MNKLGTTDAGNIIVEMTPEEWERQNEVAEDDLIAWREKFKEGIINDLGLSPKTRLTLLRAAGIKAGYCPDSYLKLVKKEYLFRRNGELMTFDQWCRFVLAGKIDCISIRNFGKGMQSELITAIRRYLNDYLEL